MSGPDLATPDPAACIHQHLRIDAARLLSQRITVLGCDGTADPLISVAAALRFPAYYGGTWDGFDECLRDLASWWRTDGWVLEIRNPRGPAWRTLDECWRHAAAVHAAAGRSLHLNYL